MLKHKITLSYDEDTDTLTVMHRVSVDVAGHVVSHSETVKMADEERAKAALKSLIGCGRADMESVSTLMAIRHIAAVTGTSKEKQITLTGNLGFLSDTTAEKR